ncbi:hypothetical protein FQA39_LY00650 [Lamprigera yunnana]|nr:hypothetical protein FQA39_LY00650 [Lamprigera yunnana]
MSISTRNTNANYRPNFSRKQNVFQSNGPRSFKSEELFNINEGHNDSEPIQDDFEDLLVDYNEDLIEADKNDEMNDEMSLSAVVTRASIISGVSEKAIYMIKKE